MTEKNAFIAGVGDDQGFAWQVAKGLAENGFKIILGVWVPIFDIFKTSLERGKFDNSRKLSDGSMLEFAAIYPMDALYDTAESVPQEVRENKRYQKHSGYSMQELVAKVESDLGHVDYVMHSLANGPEVKKPLLETSRSGYLSAVSSSAYSFVSIVQNFGPIMKAGGAFCNLSYMASTRVVPGYGGGMSSAKAALESDTRTLAFEAARKWGVRVNCISAGPYRSRAARAIGFIDSMIEYAQDNAPLTKELLGSDVKEAAKFLLSDKASAITGQVLFVDNGLSIMGISTAKQESPIQKEPLSVS